MGSIRLKVQDLCTKFGLTRVVLIAVFKNALPSTAALWVIQSSQLGQSFDTVGYLPIIVTILLAPSQPRIPYLRLLIFTIFLQCIVLCIALLAGYCSVQARIHTTPLGDRSDAYNSSAATVSAIWLIFTVWALQTYRTYQPHRTRSVVLCTIFSEVSIVTITKLSDMKSVISFNLQLFEMFLLGYAFSAFVSIFIFPQTSRDVTSADIAKMFDLSKKATCMVEPFGGHATSDSSTIVDSAAATHVLELSRAFAKFQIDVSDAKKDIGWSHLSPTDFKGIVYHLRVFILPLRGLFAVESIRTTLQFDNSSPKSSKEKAHKEPADMDSKESWDTLFEKLQEPMSHLRQLTEDAINHCCISLHMPGWTKLKETTANNTRENNDEGAEKTVRVLPGGTDFVECFGKQIEQRRDSLRLLILELKQQELGLGSAENVSPKDPTHKPHTPTGAQGRLLFALYIEYLYNGVLDALQELVLFCDGKYTHSKRKLQLPGKKRFLKLIRRLTEHNHVEGDLEEITSEIPNLTPQRSRPADAHPHKLHDLDPRRFLRYLEKPYAIFGSPQSFFGLKVACAVLSAVIPAFLHQTQQWFFNRRGLWAAVFIPFSMAPSSGEAKSMLFYRIIGTGASIVVAILNWYIADGVPAAVIVVFFIFLLVEQYYMVRFPQWGSFWRPCVITHAIIVGYSLQAKNSPTPQPPATTTSDFPVYLIGPYRGLCTIIGVAVAYIWTVFPQPTTAKSIMQRRLGQALFTLAEFQNCMHWAITSWASGEHGDMNDKGSLAHKLMKTRHRLFVQETALLAVIRDQHKFAHYDLSFGESSTEDRFVTIADEVDRIMSYLNVIIFVSAHFQSHIHRRGSFESQSTSPWASGMSDLSVVSKVTSRQLAALIHILASSVLNNQPLPPFLEVPKPFIVARKLRKLRPDLMSFEHSDELGYKAFAAIEVSVAMMTKSLDRVLVLVRDIFGEIGVDVEAMKEKSS